MTNKSDVDELVPADCSEVKYHPISENDKWKVNFIREATDVKFKQLEVNGFNPEEIEEIIDYLCSS